MSATRSPRHFVATVPLRWRDLDHQGHVYHAEMLTLLDEARTRWFREAIGRTSPDEYVVARIEIDYVGETPIDGGHIDVSIAVARIGRTSLTTAEQVFLADGTFVARATVTAVMWDREIRGPRPLTPEEKGACEAFLPLTEVEHA